MCRLLLLRATSESIADCDLSCFGFVRCFAHGCATMCDHDVIPFLEGLMSRVDL
jgi:hypothetical protein